MQIESTTSTSFASSLVGSLCREVDRIRKRSVSIKNTIHSTNDLSLIKRLEKEYGSLKERKAEILESTFLMSDKLIKQSISLCFLREICLRE